LSLRPNGPTFVSRGRSPRYGMTIPRSPNGAKSPGAARCPRNCAPLGLRRQLLDATLGSRLRPSAQG